MASRTNFFDAMVVSTFDATNSQIALGLGMKNRVSDYFSPGVVNGLTVFSDSNDGNHVAVSLGTAYRNDGERINVPVAVRGIGYNNANLNAVAANYTVVVRYVEANDGTTGIDLNGTSNFRHILDSYSLNVLKNGTDTLLSNDVRLSGVLVTAPGSSFIFDNTVRDTSVNRVGANITVSLPAHGQTHAQGGADPIPNSVRVITSSGNVSLTVADDYVVINKAANELTTVTLPSGTLVDEVFTVKGGKGDEHLRPITVVPATGQIDGTTASFIDVAYAALTFVYNGVQYNVV